MILAYLRKLHISQQTSFQLGDMMNCFNCYTDYHPTGSTRYVQITVFVIGGDFTCILHGENVVADKNKVTQLI
jgi:hypothetical protein